MWKPNQPGSPSQSPSTEPTRPSVPAASHEPTTTRTSSTSPASPAAADQATIGKSLVVKGEVTGSESLYIDGKVEGAINLPGNRVTVGRNGQVSANISAREVVVLGKVRGNDRGCDCTTHQHRRWRLLQGWNRHPQAWPGQRRRTGCKHVQHRLAKGRRRRPGLDKLSFEPREQRRPFAGTARVVSSDDPGFQYWL
jgi:Polymer-forming cytoskeletal